MADAVQLRSEVREMGDVRGGVLRAPGRPRPTRRPVTERDTSATSAGSERAPGARGQRRHLRLAGHVRRGDRPRLPSMDGRRRVRRTRPRRGRATVRPRCRPVDRHPGGGVGSRARAEPSPSRGRSLGRRPRPRGAHQSRLAAGALSGCALTHVPKKVACAMCRQRKVGHGLHKSGHGSATERLRTPPHAPNAPPREATGRSRAPRAGQSERPSTSRSHASSKARSRQAL